MLIFSVSQCEKFAAYKLIHRYNKSATIHSQNITTLFPLPNLPLQETK